VTVPIDTAQALYDISVALRDCIRDRLALTTAGVPTSMRVCVVPGQIAWDTCQCGQLDITTTRIFYSRQFPQEATGAESNCTLPYIVAEVTVSVLRCAPTVDDNGNEPTCDELDAAAETWLDDANAVRDAVACCLAALVTAGSVSAYSLNEQVPVGPEGMCVGSEYRVGVGLLNACC
jgi:hypothetical protein